MIYCDVCGSEDVTIEIKGPKKISISDTERYFGRVGVFDQVVFTCNNDKVKAGLNKDGTQKYRRCNFLKSVNRKNFRMLPDESAEIRRLLAEAKIMKEDVTKIIKESLADMDVASKATVEAIQKRTLEDIRKVNASIAKLKNNGTTKKN